MGGQSAVRGFLIQTLSAVLTSLRDGEWQTICIEPDEGNEKIDVLWTYPDRKRAAQIKHSTRPINIVDATNWARDLAAATEAKELELVLFGYPSAEVTKAGVIAGVKIVLPAAPDTTVLTAAAAHSLDLFMEAERLAKVPAVVRELVIHALTAKLLEFAAGGAECSHAELRSAVKAWVLVCYPPAVTETLDNERFRYASELERLKAELALQKEHAAALIRLGADGKGQAHRLLLLAARRAWAAVCAVRDVAGMVCIPYAYMAPSEYASATAEELLQATGGVTEQKLMRRITRDTRGAEQMRPFMGEKLWGLFFLFRVFYVRAAVKVIRGSKSGNLPDWRVDFVGRGEAFADLFGPFLDVARVREVMSQDAPGGVHLIAGMLEQRMLAVIDDLINGREHLDVHVADQQRIAVALDRLRRMSFERGGALDP